MKIDGIEPLDDSAFVLTNTHLMAGKCTYYLYNKRPICVPKGVFNFMYVVFNVVLNDRTYLNR